MSAKPGKVLTRADGEEYEAGSYEAWSGADQPELATQGLGCGLLELHPHALTMPRYADSPMVGYVLRGTGLAGVIPVAGHDKEKRFWVKTGDVISLRTGDVTWWYNDYLSDSEPDLVILFMADTARSVSPGDISYFFLAGGNSVLRGLDAKAWAPDMTAEQATAAFRGQKDVLFTKLSGKVPYVVGDPNHMKGLVVNTEDVAAGTVKTLTGADLPALGDLGISVAVGRLEPGAACAPWVVRDGGEQAVYVARGSARVQVSSAAGGDTLLLDEEVSAGSLFVVPPFAVAFLAATGTDGVEWVSLIKSPRAAEHLTGLDSVFSLMEPAILNASMLNNVRGSIFKGPEMVGLLTDRNKNPTTSPP